MVVSEKQRAVAHDVIDVPRTVFVVCVGAVAATLHERLSANGPTRTHRRIASAREYGVSELLDCLHLSAPRHARLVARRSGWFDRLTTTSGKKTLQLAQRTIDVERQ